MSLTLSSPRSGSGPNRRCATGLAHLQAAEFLYETSLFPGLEYTFRHALTYEVAYGSVLRRAAARAARPGSWGRLLAAL